MRNISRQGVYEIAAIFEQIGFAFREQSVEDYGIDAIIEERADSGLSGKLIGVQIKCGTSFFREIKDNKVIFRGDINHYNYWLNYSLPVIIVLYNPEDSICIYEVISADTIVKTEKAWKIEIDLDNRLEQASMVLSRLGDNLSESQKRLSTLAFSKELMQLADQRILIIEVFEWVNKSSGRGEFFLKRIDDSGQEIELYSKTIIGFGLKPYDQVIRELFPWAEPVIDEEYYDMYGDADYIEHMKQFNPVIYPYANVVHEVDKYRFIPALNEIGQAFLTLDNFIEHGKMYNIIFVN